MDTGGQWTPGFADPQSEDMEADPLFVLKNGEISDTGPGDEKLRTNMRTNQVGVDRGVNTWYNTH